MPKITRLDLYKAILSSARKKFAIPRVLNKFFITRSAGSSLYRYVEYYKSQPQNEDAGRTIWAKFEDDINNRWTGSSDVDKKGSQGLYTSGEFINVDSPFPELEHYQNTTVKPSQNIGHFQYQAGQKPQWIRTDARELRTMFLFTQTRPLNGVDFSLEIESAEHSLLTEILNQARQIDPNAFNSEDSLKKLYTSPDDASFNRAIGNALFEVSTVDFFQATSVRDGMSPNIILRGTSRTPIDYLRAEGRATFLVNPEGRRGIGVYTIDDLIYNSKFEQTGLGKILPRDVSVNLLSPYETAIKSIASKEVNWNYLSSRIADVVNRSVSDALNRMDNPFNQSIEYLTVSLSAQTGLRDSLYRELSDSILIALSKSQDFSTLFTDIGIEGIRSVSDARIVEPRYLALVNAPPNIVNSYLEIAVRNTLLEQKMHWLRENQSKIQQDLTGAESRISETSSEIQSKQDSLREVETQLASSPDDPNLQQRRNDLNREISDMVRRQAEVETEKARLEEDKQQTERDAREASEEKDRSVRELDSRRNEVFKGE